MNISWHNARYNIRAQTTREISFMQNYSFPMKISLFPLVTVPGCLTEFYIGRFNQAVTAIFSYNMLCLVHVTVKVPLSSTCILIYLHSWMFKLTFLLKRPFLAAHDVTKPWRCTSEVLWCLTPAYLVTCLAEMIKSWYLHAEPTPEINEIKFKCCCWFFLTILYFEFQWTI